MIKPTTITTVALTLAFAFSAGTASAAKPPVKSERYNQSANAQFASGAGNAPVTTVGRASANVGDGVSVLTVRNINVANVLGRSADWGGASSGTLTWNGDANSNGRGRDAGTVVMVRGKVLAGKSAKAKIAAAIKRNVNSGGRA
jgi:hypothetical protein